jgi:alpha,alpha-trehalose phosphorylase
VSPAPVADPGSVLPLRRAVSPRRRLLPPADVYPVDPWRIVERRFYPRFLPQMETIFATSNGYLGIRGTFEEGIPRFEYGTYMNGFYETWPIVYGEEAFGFAKTGQTMLHIPDGTLMQLYVDDEPFDLERTQASSFERVLDMRAGTLDRTVRFETPDGKELEIHSRRLVSLEHRHLACLVYEVAVLHGHVSLSLSSELVTPPPREQTRQDDPRRAMGLGGALVPTDRRARDRRILLNLATRSSGLRMACAMDHVLEADCAVDVESEVIEDRGRVVFHAEVEPGQRIRVVKLLAYHHSARADDGELRFRTNRTLDRVLRDGVDRVFEEQRARMERFWEASDVEVEGDEDVQQAIRFNLFQIFQASARSHGFGVPAKGLSGLGYEGHYFWDTEIYLLPFLTYTQPRIARNLLLHRHTQLPEARARAVEVGHPGAMYPWRTISGEEASAYYAAGTAQYHINADICYAAGKYVALTGDFEFLARGFAEMAVETARLWADLGFYSERKGGRFVINGVTGPDEYNTVVDNNAYTNLMARQNLRIATLAVEFLRSNAPEGFRRLIEATRLDLSELEEWTRAADLMYVPYDEKAGVHLQDDGFLEREVWDFAGTPPEHYPLLLHYHPLVIYRHQVIKQADVVLATLLLGDEFTEEEKRRIFDYYDPLTTGDSSLSVCIQSIMASELGYPEKAHRYFADAVVMDLGDIGGNVRDGLHVASLGGTWMALVYGFAGLRDHEGRLRFRPKLPAGWRRLRFRLRVHGQILEVDIRPDQVTYHLLTGDGGLDLTHEDEPLRLTPTEPLTRPVEPTPSTDPPAPGAEDPQRGDVD